MKEGGRVADMYEVLAEDPLAIATVKDRHRDDCPRGCTEHRHERIDVRYGGTFDVADLSPRTNVPALVSAGMIRKVEPTPAAEQKPPAADKPADKAKKDG